MDNIHTCLSCAMSQLVNNQPVISILPDSTKAIWLVKKHDPKTYFVQFYKVEANDKVGIVTVKCIPLDAINTEVKVSYQYIGIDEKGNKFISTFTAKDYSAYIDEWETLLNKYFASQP